MPAEMMHPEGPEDRGDLAEPTAFDEESGLPILDVQTLHIQVGDWSADVLPIYALPGFRVLDMMDDTGPSQIIKTAALFRLAIMDRDGAERMEELSFSELTEALNQWAALSNERA